MEQIGKTTFLLSGNEKRVLAAPDERIELEDIDIPGAVQRINETYMYLQAMHAEDDKLLSHERALAMHAFLELAIDKKVLERIIEQVPIDSDSLTPEQIIG